MNDPITKEDYLLAKSMRDNPLILMSIKDFCKRARMDIPDEDTEIFKMFAEAIVLKFIRLARERRNGN